MSRRPSLHGSFSYLLPRYRVFPGCQNFPAAPPTTTQMYNLVRFAIGVRRRALPWADHGLSKAEVFDMFPVSEPLKSREFVTSASIRPGKQGTRQLGCLATALEPSANTHICLCSVCALTLLPGRHLKEGTYMYLGFASTATGCIGLESPISSPTVCLSLS